MYSNKSQENNPPPLPTPDWPGYNVTLHNRSPNSILNDDTLLEIFNHCRLQDEEVWNYQLRWCKLSHVCRKWRQLIYESTSHLNIQIVLTNKRPLCMLGHLPPLPLAIDYRSTEGAEDISGMLHAIQQRDRIRRVVLQAPNSTLEQFIVTINELFLRLDMLTLLSTTKSEGNSELILPRTFTAQIYATSHYTVSPFQQGSKHSLPPLSSSH